MKTSLCILLSLVFGRTLLYGQCNNTDFESTNAGAYTTATAVTGWYISGGTFGGCTAGDNWTGGSSEFSIVTTPFTFASAGTLPHSPLGGTKVARLNDYNNNYSKTKISTTLTITATNPLFRFAFAAVFSGVSDCCSSAGLYMKMTTCSNAVISCGTFTLGPLCNNVGVTYTNNQWTSWQVKTVDLSPYIGTCVNVEVWCNDNAFGGQYGAAAFDAQCGSGLPTGFSPFNNTPVSLVSFCPNSNIATLSAPQGYSSYSWTAASSLTPLSSSQATLSAITITNPVAGGIFSLVASNPSYCVVPFVYTLATTQVSVAGVGSAPTCTAGSAGAASVFATGGSSYTYTWTNSSNSVVSTASVAAGLSPGPYTVAVSSNNNSCGTATAVVTVNVGNKAPNYYSAPYCGNMAFLQSNGGSNFQWYTGTTAVSTATNSAFTYTSPTNNGIVRLGFNNLGCRDSSIYTLVSSPPGTISAVSSGTGCPGTLGGNINFTLVPVTNLPGTQFYTLTSTTQTGITTGTISTYSYSVTGLSLGNTYSLVVFDGTCLSSTLVPVNGLVPKFTVLTGPGQGTVCSGNSTGAYAVTNLNPAQYSFAWSPTVFLTPGNQNLQAITITPTIAPGNSSITIYTVVVTPTAANCPQTATYAVAYTNPATPSITGIPPLCINSGNYTIVAAPQNGSFGPAAFQSGTFNTNSLGAGTHTFSYSSFSGSCVTTASSSIYIYPLPNVSITGNQAVCAGKSVTLTANGASTYSWSNNQLFQSIVVSPTANTTYTVIGFSQPGNCNSSAVVTTTSLPLPLLKITGTPSICAGGTATLQAMGALSYSWSSGQTSNPISVTPSVTTNYTVHGTGDNGCSVYDTISVRVIDCTGIIELKGNSSSYRIFPNPFHDSFVIEVGLESQLQVYDLSGRLLYDTRLKTGQNTVHADYLQPGLYFITLTNEKTSVSGQLLKLE